MENGEGWYGIAEQTLMWPGPDHMVSTFEVYGDVLAHQLKACTAQITYFATVFGFCCLFVWGIPDLSMVPPREGCTASATRGRLAGTEALSPLYILRGQNPARTGTGLARTLALTCEETQGRRAVRKTRAPRAARFTHITQPRKETTGRWRKRVFIRAQGDMRALACARGHIRAGEREETSDGQS